jgi:hypothetical protein
MRRLEVNFAGRGARAPWPGRVLLVLALALSLDVTLSYRELRAALEHNQARLAERPRVASAARNVGPEELAAVRDTLERLAMPWEGLFAALEAATTDEVALLGIEPDPKAGTVVISGDSKNYLAALSYVLNLSRAENLQRVQLVRHELKANDPQRPVAFAVSAGWSEARP